MDTQLEDKQIDGRQIDDRQIDDRQIDGRQLDDSGAQDVQLDDIQLDDKELEDTLAASLADLVPEAKKVSEDEFVEVVGGALEAVGGTLLFKMCVQNEGEGQHVAAASIGDGGNRQFLLLTLPTGGGPLKVETTSRSTNPVAGIAAAYAGLMDVFRTAA
ncbi:hypothetical protein NLY43_08140 [Mesorhizobium sp. C416B]|nr:MULTISPECIES: hypothetical protein [unclassified Mesorhizobium]WJI64709.1 hypothetical protein NLY43_08140 [Mesorhizobium sp. C416B]